MYYRWKVLPLKRKGNAILILLNFNLGVDHGIVADFFGKTKVKYLRLGGNASESPISIANWVKEGKTDLIKPPNIQCSHLASFFAIALVSCTEEEPFKAITTCACCNVLFIRVHYDILVPQFGERGWSRLYPFRRFIIFRIQGSFLLTIRQSTVLLVF